MYKMYTYSFPTKTRTPAPDFPEIWRGEVLKNVNIFVVIFNIH